MKDAILNETELKKIFVLISFDQARSWGLGKRHEVREIAGEVLAKENARRSPWKSGRKLEYDWLT
jgi:hypothetical protein